MKYLVRFPQILKKPDVSMYPILFLILFFSGCSQTTEALEFAFPNLNFTRPVDLQHAGDDSDRLFVAEQAGVIRVFPNDSETSVSHTFLDIRDRVRDSGNEEGLLGLAFHPFYEDNGHFYVNYTASDPRRTVISRFSVSTSNADEADASSELVVLEFAQPYGNHNGGQITFGPDGYLYIGVGDGGSAGDPSNNGQNRNSLLVHSQLIYDG